MGRPEAAPARVVVRKYSHEGLTVFSIGEMMRERLHVLPPLAFAATIVGTSKKSR
jgi:hypothetical protein